MAELVREDAKAAVLGFDREVADPVAGVADLRAAEPDIRAVDRWTGHQVVGRVGIRAL